MPRTNTRSPPDRTFGRRRDVAAPPSPKPAPVPAAAQARAPRLIVAAAAFGTALALYFSWRHYPASRGEAKLLLTLIVLVAMIGCDQVARCFGTSLFGRMNSSAGDAGGGDWDASDGGGDCGGD